ncbi:hypothetical protein FO519_008809 [Halicephalobus sp. NKZ332]|nr:hypothetical protein FO519_008809 [Halicephalobus sp. NKZ332]
MSKSVVSKSFEGTESEMSLYQKNPESARSADTPLRISSLGGHPFHPGLFGRYATQIAHFHANLDLMNPAQISQLEADKLDQMIAELISSMNRLHQELAVASRPGYAMVQSDPGDRAKQLFRDALEVAKIYKNNFIENQEKLEKKFLRIKTDVLRVPVLDGSEVTFKDFWPRWEYFVGNSPLPDMEKFDLLLSRLSPGIRKEVKHLAFDEKSYTDVIEILQRF